MYIFELPENYRQTMRIDLKHDKKKAIWLNTAALFIEIILLVVLFTLNKVTTTGWAPAVIVFGCSVFAGYIRGAKVVVRRFWRTLLVGLLIFLIFFLVTFIAGVYSLVVTVPIVAALLCMYDMTTFFTSQGMRFYVNNSTILTPKKLEEVDNINKARYII